MVAVAESLQKKLVELGLALQWTERGEEVGMKAQGNLEKTQPTSLPSEAAEAEGILF